MQNEDYKKTNREKRMSPTSDSASWCESCDKDKVYEGKKCNTCGALNGVKKLKKDT